MSITKPTSPPGKLVSFPSRSGVVLDGMWFQSDDDAITIVHVHGSFGNFYSNPFVRTMAHECLNAGANLLLFNCSGHDAIAEGERNGVFEYVGGALARFDESRADLGGAIDFVTPQSRAVLLQGHSLGCDRVLSYLLREEHQIDRVILLAPCDSYQLQSRWLRYESVEEQTRRLSTMPIDDEMLLLPTSEYGVRQGEGWEYSIPISKRALLSLLQGDVFRLLRFDRPPQFSVDVSVLLCVGGRDQLQTAPAEFVTSYFRACTREVTAIVVPEADHMLSPAEALVASKIVSWAQEEI